MLLQLLSSRPHFCGLVGINASPLLTSLTWNKIEKIYLTTVQLKLITIGSFAELVRKSNLTGHEPDVQIIESIVNEMSYFISEQILKKYIL